MEVYGARKLFFKLFLRVQWSKACFCCCCCFFFKCFSDVIRVGVWSDPSLLDDPVRSLASWRFAFPDQGRSQDFSVGTHSFPSHLLTPPPKKKDQNHFRFPCLLFQIACARVLIEYRFFCLLFLWVSMCERHCLSCESITFCSSPFASIYVTYYKKQQCVHGFITPTDSLSFISPFA